MMDILMRFSGQLLAGAGLTLQLTAIAALLACALALPLAIARCSERGLLRWPIRLFVSFFRGTPLLAQLFLVYYGSRPVPPPPTQPGGGGVFFPSPHFPPSYFLL